MSTNVAILDNMNMAPQFDFVGIANRKVSDIQSLIKGAKKGVAVIAGEAELSDSDVKRLRKFQSDGGRLLVLNAPKLAQRLYPEHITGTVDTWQMADIAFMERNDYPVFDGIEPLELRYFNNGRRELPLVCKEVFHVNRNENLTELAGHMRVHGYCDFKTPEQHQERVSEFRGFPLVAIADGKGKAIVSGMALEKASTDPIAGHLLLNIVNELTR